MSLLVSYEHVLGSFQIRFQFVMWSIDDHVCPIFQRMSAYSRLFCIFAFRWGNVQSIRYSVNATYQWVFTFLCRERFLYCLYNREYLHYYKYCTSTHTSSFKAAVWRTEDKSLNEPKTCKVTHLGQYVRFWYILHNAETPL